MFKGIIIEESLQDPFVLSRMKIISTETETVTENFHTPWLKQWTLHTVEIPEERADEVAEALSLTLLPEPGTWYADFYDARTHYVVFPKRVFKIDRSDASQYEAAKAYGLDQGVPVHQLDWSSNTDA